MVGKQTANLSSDMSHPEEILDPDFEAQLRGLFEQAERVIEGGTAAAENYTPQATGAAASSPQKSVPQEKAAPEADAPATQPAPVTAAVADLAGSKVMGLSLPQMLKPVVLGLEVVSRATTENTAILKRLDTAATSSAAAGKELPGVVADLRALVDSKNGLSQSMFAALHEELKGYKDGFLLDSVHRPIIRDLISLYDDTAEIYRQVAAAIEDTASREITDDAGKALLERIRTIEMNLEHHMEFIAEVLNRLEVTIVDPHMGKLDKQTQRAVAVEMAEDPDEDGNVVRIAKRGFLWKDRIFRAEEVVIRKWKEGFLVALTAEGKR
jgi:molecular chaperone GrpE (heat shock protein)